MKKLTIVNGIIQDKFIDGIPVNISIVKPSGRKNVRRIGTQMIPIGVATHETGNSSPTANDTNHAIYLQNLENQDKVYLSAHIFIDDDSITQTLPLNEPAWHAGDGANGIGNSRYIAAEICINRNVLQARANGQSVIASIIVSIPGCIDLKPHQAFSGKNCPARILAENNGWANFVVGVKHKMSLIDRIFNPIPTPPKVPAPVAATVAITGSVWGYKTAADALADRNRVKVVPVGTYPIMIKHTSGAWNIGTGYMYWINPAKITKVNTVVTSNQVTISKQVWGYKTASDAMIGRNKIRIVPRGTYPIMIKHRTGAWNIGKGNLYWINPKDI